MTFSSIGRIGSSDPAVVLTITTELEQPLEAINALESQAVENKNALEDIYGQLELFMDEISEMREQVAEYENQNLELQKLLSEKDQTAIQEKQVLQNQINDYEIQIRDLKSKISSLEADMVKLENAQLTKNEESLPIAVNNNETQNGHRLALHQIFCWANRQLPISIQFEERILSICARTLTYGPISGDEEFAKMVEDSIYFVSGRISSLFEYIKDRKR